ncbi:hypothetical protein AFB00_05335 [Pseudonocardia sp. HH130630-07]|nr:hypothetical protein AFB00_05335 [Pseudonocardia sp. HH130630-07]
MPGPVPAGRERDWRRIRAAWTLAVLAPVCAELTFTAVAVPFTWVLLPLLMVMYGAGVLLVREAAVRAGAGWPSLVLLGLAYQLAEDGLGLQALTSPDMYGAADWGLRGLGINWTYWESQIGVHVVLSVLVPIALTGMLFPELKERPYLGTGGLIGTGALAVLGVLGLRYVISASEDPGYSTPTGATVAFGVAIVVLAVVALGVLPRRRRPEGPRKGRAPHHLVVGFVSFYLTMAFLTTLLPLGLGPDLLFGEAMSPFFRLVAAAMTAVPFAWLVARWRRATNWDDRNRVWLFGGILVSHTAFMMLGSVTAAIVGAVVIAAEIALLVALARHLRRRSAPLRPALTDRGDARGIG